MVEPTPRPLHLFLGGLLGGIVGVLGFIVLPLAMGDATEDGTLDRFTEGDTIETTAARPAPREPSLWEVPLARPDWEDWSARLVFVFEAKTTNESGDGRAQVDIMLRVQGQEAADRILDIDTRDGDRSFRIAGDAITIDPDEALVATASMRVQRFPGGGGDWSITLVPGELRQESKALDTDHDGVPQPLQPLGGLPSYLVTAILALVGVNAAYLVSRHLMWKRKGP